MASYNARPKLPLDQWPELDRLLWANANMPEDELEDCGAASGLRQSTRDGRVRVYSFFLRVAKEAGLLRPAKTLADRISRDILQMYIAERKPVVAVFAIAQELRAVSAIIGTMDPKVDRGLINRTSNRLAAKAGPHRSYADRMISPIALMEFGQSLIEEGRSLLAQRPCAGAMRFRNGLLIRALTTCPLRPVNYERMMLGKHLTGMEHKLTPCIEFEAHEVKSNRPLRVPVSSLVVEDLRFYVEELRPLLASTKCDNVWLTGDGTPMMAADISNNIAGLTERRLGVRISGHMFRHIVATHITEHYPEVAPMAASVLQHTNYKMTRKHYVKGQQHLACHRYHAEVDAIIDRSTTPEPEDF